MVPRSKQQRLNVMFFSLNITASFQQIWTLAVEQQRAANRLFPSLLAVAVAFNLIKTILKSGRVR